MTTKTIEQPTEQECAHGEPVDHRPQFQPGVDILDQPDELTVLADIPGSSAEDIDIHFEQGTLTLHAKVRDREPGAAGRLATEYGVGDFHRTFRIGEVIDPARISADYQDGVLALHLPKTEAVKPRRIAVQAN